MYIIDLCSLMKRREGCLLLEMSIVLYCELGKKCNCNTTAEMPR